MVVKRVSKDETLIIRAQRGDRESLNILIERHWDGVYRLAFYRLGQAEEAREITQETFCRALRALPHYQKTEASFKTYLGRIALNLITDYWRKKGRSPQLVEIGLCQEPLVDPAEQPENTALAAERRQEVSRLLDLLPSEQRRAVELRIIAGLSVRETARIMEKSEGAVKMLQQRALHSLRRLLTEHGLLQ